MKSIKNFSVEELPKIHLNAIYGGTKRATCTEDNQCDIHWDFDDDGLLDPGECIDIVKCED